MIANIAQLVELLICNQWVGSSSLSVGTIKPLGFPRVLFYPEKIKNIVIFF